MLADVKTKLGRTDNQDQERLQVQLLNLNRGLLLLTIFINDDIQGLVLDFVFFHDCVSLYLLSKVGVTQIPMQSPPLRPIASRPIYPNSFPSSSDNDPEPRDEIEIDNIERFPDPMIVHIHTRLSSYPREIDRTRKVSTCSSTSLCTILAKQGPVPSCKLRKQVDSSSAGSASSVSTRSHIVLY